MENTPLPNEPPQFVHPGVRELASLLFAELQVGYLSQETTEQALDFVLFLKEHLGNVNGEEYEVLWFKMRLYRDWLEERITILTTDVKRKQSDPVILAKFRNSDNLRQAFLRKYWNRVVCMLNEIVRAGLLGVIATHTEFVRQYRGRGDSRSLAPFQTDYLEQWFLAHIQNPYPTAREKIRISWQCHMLPQQVSNWFGNKRMRSKREMQAHKRVRNEVVQEDIDRIEGHVVEVLENPPEEPPQNYEQMLAPFNVNYDWWPLSNTAPVDEDTLELVSDFIFPDETFYEFNIDLFK